MCGRYSLATPQEELVEVFEVPPLTFDYVPRYNIAPGQEALVVATDRRGRRMGPLRWGLVPARAEPPGRPFVNARGESVASTRSFRDAFAHRRCLIPADGFYEWRKEGSAKVPYWFHPVEGGVLALAAIWEHWETPGHGPRDGFAILTVEANEDVAPVHHRMPVVVDPGDFDLWLDRAAPPGEVSALIRPLPGGLLAHHAVSPRVNSASEDHAGLVEPV